MSRIRDRILRGEPATGTIDDLAEWFVESFLALAPIEQAQVRKDIYEQLTGKPFRPVN